MANAVIVDIAEAVVTVLNAADLSEEFTAVRSYRPTYELPDVATALQVAVVPRERPTRAQTRTARTGDYGIDVAVLSKPDRGADGEVPNTALDPLMYLLEEIEDLFVGNKLTGYATATCISANPIEGSDAGYSPEYLGENGQFTGVTRLTFRVP
jgi:hypothetical protein